MARGINKVILIGILGDEPQFITGRSGRTCATLTLITRDPGPTPVSTPEDKITQWHRVILPEALTELAQMQLHKNSCLYVEGRLQTRSFTDKRGLKRNVTEIIARTALLLPGILP